MNRSSAAAPAEVAPPPGSDSVQVDGEELLGAIESLYEDKLKPFARLLRKRLVERARVGRRQVGDLTLRNLKVACEACPGLEICPEEGGEWSALLEGRPVDELVDFHSPEDPFASGVWAGLEAYFAGDDACGSHPLPGGRYACAKALIVRRLEPLRGLSLGEVCHVVQLAISKKRILGYLNGALVPFRFSETQAKERCAQQRLTAVGAPTCADDTAGWEVLRRCFVELANTQRCRVERIAHLKRLLLSRFGVRLSETALGHTKLSSVLRDDRLADVCSVRLGPEGYMVEFRIPGPTPLKLDSFTFELDAPPGDAGDIVEGGDAAALSVCLTAPTLGNVSTELTPPSSTRSSEPSAWTCQQLGSDVGDDAHVLRPSLPTISARGTEGAGAERLSHRGGFCVHNGEGPSCEGRPGRRMDATAVVGDTVAVVQAESAVVGGVNGLARMLPVELPYYVWNTFVHAGEMPGVVARGAAQRSASL